MENNNSALTPPKAVVSQLPPAFLRTMSSLLDREGIDFAAECRRRGLDLPAWLDNALDIPRPLHEDFERCIVELTRHQPQRWLALGLALRLPAYGVLGLATLTAPSLREILSLNTQYRGLPFSLAGLDPIALGDGEGVRWDMGQVPTEFRDFTLTRDIAATRVAMNDIWAGEFPFTRLLLAPAHAHLAELLEPLRIPLAIDDAGTCLLWHVDSSARPLPYGDSDLHQFYSGQCRQLATHSAFGDPFLDRVGRAIEAALHTQPQAVSLARIARMLAISVRTLQRRLGDRRMSFRAISDRVRRELAEHFLRDPSIPLADVAFRLGYSEPAGFHHAFQRWLGVSPSAYRRDCAVPAAGVHRF